MAECNLVAGQGPFCFFHFRGGVNGSGGWVGDGDCWSWWMGVIKPAGAYVLRVPLSPPARCHPYEHALPTATGLSGWSHPQGLRTAAERCIISLLVRGGAVWQLVGLITRRSQVQILPPLPTRHQTRKRFRKRGRFFRRGLPDCRTRSLHHAGARSIIPGLAVYLMVGSATSAAIPPPASTRSWASQGTASARPAAGIQSPDFTGHGAQRALFHFRKRVRTLAPSSPPAEHGSAPWITKAGCERQGNRNRESARSHR